MLIQFIHFKEVIYIGLTVEFSKHKTHDPPVVWRKQVRNALFMFIQVVQVRLIQPFFPVQTRSHFNANAHFLQEYALDAECTYRMRQIHKSQSCFASLTSLLSQLFLLDINGITWKSNLS